ncbi:DDHD-domain-containing protein [Anaeromyces robustus]|uniref:DDHD-domain-containing protein n=1 Tax=Anaeromyces robustus TaxID=1754192 RepID=A0A1Y1XPA8_9FUNG|nr:DDHD-domain-containing protein [Anaeromyces robustus]|eukprot:ORX87505.1 DDHD-domain-containing protein [Anaeromyces robustus]
MALKEAPVLVPYWFHSLEHDNKHKETPNIRIEFSSNDSKNLEKAYQKLKDYENGKILEKPPETVDVMDDLLFEVNIPNRKLTPIYWKGKTYEVVRGTWFYATDMYKFLACDEELSRQIEEGYQQAEPWKMEPPKNNIERSKTFIDYEDKRNYKLTGPYIGQSITYSGPNSAWLLSTNIASQLARAVMTKITNNENIGGTRLIRGYTEVEKWKQRNEEELRNKNTKGKRTRSRSADRKQSGDSISSISSSLSMTKIRSKNNDRKQSEDSVTSLSNISMSSITAEKREEPDENTKFPEKSNTEYSINNYAVNEEETKDHRYDKIEHLVFVVHGIGEKFAEEKSVSTIEKSVNDIRRTAKEVAKLYFAKNKSDHRGGLLPKYPSTSESAYKNVYVPEGTGVQFLPVNWRRNMNMDKYKRKKKHRRSNLGLTLKKSLSNLEKRLEAEKKKKEAENEEDVKTEEFLKEKESNDDLKLKKSAELLKPDADDDKAQSESDIDDDDDDDDDFPRMQDVMLESIPLVRTLVMDLALDVLFYMIPRYYQQMISILADELNRLYKIFIQHHPDFNGKVSFFGHSLGSQLCFDLLCHQIPECLKKEKGNVDVVRYNRLTPYGNEVTYNYKQLDFPVHTFFAVGSPIGLFTVLSDRNIRFFDWKNPSTKGLTNSDTLVPIVKKMYNIFHPSDPVAHRIEPLILKKKNYNVGENGDILKPNPVPYSKGGLTGTVREFQGMQKDIAQRSMKLFGNVYSAVQAFIDPNNEKAKANNEKIVEEVFDPRDIKNINPNGRLDYMIQENVLDNQYISAIPAHSSYWNDQDTISLVLSELYRDMKF